MLTVRVRRISRVNVSIHDYVEVRVSAHKLTGGLAARAAKESGLSGSDFVVYDPQNKHGFKLTAGRHLPFTINF